MSEQVRYFTVTEDELGQRLDNYLLSRLKGMPKSAVYKIIRKGEVRVNKGRVKPDTRLQVGDMVRVPPVRLAQQGEVPKPSAKLGERLGAAILRDQDGLMVLDKPSGLAVHGGSGVNLGMIEALRQLPGNHGFLELVHRLDRETSGCVMVARKRAVLKLLQAALRERNFIRKRYYALVQGQWPKNLSKVDVPLKRFVTPSGERIVRVHQDGKPSLTEFEVITRYRNATLLQASPITGRTHQIRVHALHAGCPLVGDVKYGETELNNTIGGGRSMRLFLHAHSLQLTLPAPFDFSIEAPMPLELQRALTQLIKL